MSYVIYLRKSRSDTEAELHGEGETLARHEKALLDLAKRQDLNIVNIYREVVSGETIAARPMMQQLLGEVEAGMYKGVLVMEVERLARGDTIDQGIVAQTFKFSDTKIITPTKIYDPNNEFDEEYFEFGLFMSRREYKTINRRLQRGRLSSIKEGKYVANHPPYGYSRIKLTNEKGFTLEPIPDQATVIQMIFELYTHGELTDEGAYNRIGVSLIAKRLNSLNIKPQKGDAWVDSSIRDILINPIYIGKIRWNWRPSKKKMVNGKIEKERPRSDEVILVDGLHPAIISEETYNLAQDIMQSNRKAPISDRKTLKNPLAGLVVCGKCGRTMRRRPKGERTPYDTIMCPAAHCTNVGVKFESVENRILDMLEKYYHNYQIELKHKTIKRNNTELNVVKTRLEKYDDEIAEATKQMNTIYESYEKGVYSSDIFIMRSKLLTERIETLTSEKALLEHEYLRKTSSTVNSDFIMPRIAHILDVYHTLPTAQAKNDLLKDAIKSIKYTKERSGHWKNVDPEDYTLDIELRFY